MYAARAALFLTSCQALQANILFAHGFTMYGEKNPVAFIPAIVPVCLRVTRLPGATRLYAGCRERGRPPIPIRMNSLDRPAASQYDMQVRKGIS
jgi:hypothetical protein